MHWRLSLWTCINSSNWSEQREIRRKRHTLKNTMWENVGKDVNCLLECKIGLGWHVAVYLQLTNTYSLTDNAIRLSRCPSWIYNIIEDSEVRCSREEESSLATSKPPALLLAPMCWDDMTVCWCIFIIQIIIFCGYSGLRCMWMLLYALKFRDIF